MHVHLVDLVLKLILLLFELPGDVAFEFFHAHSSTALCFSGTHVDVRPHLSYLYRQVVQLVA